MVLGKGFLLALEGLNGSGKTTQCSMLQNALINQGYKVISYNFPHVPDIPQLPVLPLIKSVLSSNELINTTAGHLLFGIQRSLYQERIYSELENKRIIVLDRYTLSGMAYGFARGLNLKWMRTVERGLKCVQPDLTVFLDIDPMVALRRMLRRREASPVSSDIVVDDLFKVRDGYERLLPTCGTCYRLQGAISEIELHEQIMTVFNDVYNV